MSTIGPFVPAKLIEARMARGRSSIEVADLVGVTPSAVSQWENGRAIPRPDTIRKLAEKLEIREQYLRTARLATDDAPVFWRSFAYARKQARGRAEYQFLWLKDIVRFVHEAVEFPRLNIPELDLPRDPRDITLEEVEAAAGRLRKSWGLSDAPISDVVLMLENNGVVTTSSDFGDRALDAFSQWSRLDGLPYVVLGNGHTGARVRLDGVHELGHLLLHRHADGSEVRTPPVHKLLEQQAFRFASALLMPANSFLPDVWAPTLDTFRALKARWRVSIAAMIKRCHDLELINETQYQRLWMNYYRRGYRELEPDEDQIPVEGPRLLRRCFEVLLGEGGMTVAQILDALPFLPKDIEQLCGLPAGLLVAAGPQSPSVTLRHERGAGGGDVIAFPGRKSF